MLVRDRAQHRRHRVGRPGQLPHHRYPGDLHRGVHRHGVHRDLALPGTVDAMAPLRGDGSAGGFDPILAGAAILCLSFLGFDAVSTPETIGPEADGSAGHHDRHRCIGSDLHPAVVHLAAGVPGQPVRRCRFRLLEVMTARRWAVPELLLHRRVCCRCVGVGDHLAGVGGANSLRYGP